MTSLSQPFTKSHFDNTPHAACVTLYTRQGRVGCGTFDRTVQTGRLVDWTSVSSQSNDDENRKLQRKAAASIPPYVAVLNEGEYTAANVQKLINYSELYTPDDTYGTVHIGGPLRGILVLTSKSASTNSPESTSPLGEGTPSAEMTVSSNYAWNTAGENDGLINQDMYGLPTAYIYDEDTASYLSNVASQQSSLLLSSNEGDGNNNNDGVYPSIVADFKYYMGSSEYNGSTATSKTCLNWKDVNGEWNPKCLPLGGNSVWSIAGSPLKVNEKEERPVVWISAGLDSTSMFHEIIPGANGVASNLLAVLLAAEAIGAVEDNVLDGLYARIGFGLFQGESFGYLGSRRFFKDTIEGFECDGEVASVQKRKDEEGTVRACVSPLRADLSFMNLGEVRGMIAVDQVGNVGGGKKLYVQGGESTGDFGGFIAQVMAELSTENYMAQASSVSQIAQEDGTYPLPPSPLSSLIKLSGAASGGVVLTGYDDAFVTDSQYHSHLDSTKFQSIDKDAIASAATVLARTAVAAAYQNEANEVDAETAAAYAKELIPNEVSSSSDTFKKLYHCLFEDGNCDTFLNYGSVESKNDASRTGVDMGMGQPLGTPPNYYVGIYNFDNGQAAVRSSGKLYGSLDASADAEVKAYGNDENDAFLLRPSLLEMSVFGLLNDYLGRGTFTENSNSALATCKSTADCSAVSYCSTETSSLAVPTCAGGTCICGSRSHYHPALDEALTAAKNKYPNYFTIDGDDAGVSALYTEPFWDSGVGVRIYNDAGKMPGIWASCMGTVAALLSFAVVYRLKKKLVKEKVY